MPESKSQKPVWRLLSELRPYVRVLTLCALCVLLVNAAELLKPIVIKTVIDDFLMGGAAQGGLYSITGMGIAYFLVVAMGSGSAFLQERLIARVGQGVLHSMRMRVFAHIHRMPLAALDRFGTGRLITRATNDIETLNEFYADVLVNLFKDAFLLLGIVVFMVALDLSMALIAFCVVPLIVLTTLLIRRRLRRNFVEMKRLIGSINAFFAENIAGMRIIQAFNAQMDKLREFGKLNGAYYKTTMIQITMHSVLRPVMEVINSLAISLLIWYGYSRISGGAHLLDLGVLYAFTDYIKRFFEPINDLAEKYNTVQSAMVSVDRIYSLLDDPEQEDLSSGEHGGAVCGKIEFRDVWFAYQEENWILRGVSFVVMPGEKVAFVGETGAGKSTIISLISRFYEPQRGQILVDGVPIDRWRLEDLRRGVAVVLQDVFLFAGTVRENICIADAIEEDKVREALEVSMADTFVKRLPHGLDEVLSERGSTLSQGERQLLSFARAIAHDPSILILDEATASIDTATEQRIQKSILRISEKRTAIFIAHRLSTIEHCDTIYVLGHGNILEQGTHEELLEQNGAYAALVHARLTEDAV